MLVIGGAAADEKFAMVKGLGLVAGLGLARLAEEGSPDVGALFLLAARVTWLRSDWGGSSSGGGHIGHTVCTFLWRYGIRSREIHIVVHLHSTLT